VEEREIKSGTVLEREREARVGFEDRGYRSDRSFLTDRKTVQNGFPLP
jgi:hypothetical protein